MSDKDTKVPVYIAIIVALILVAAAGYYVLGPIGKETTPEEVTPTGTVRVTPEITQMPPSGATPTATPPQARTEVIKCELCHTNPQDLSLHVNGGKFCVNCHGTQVHSIHIGTGTVDLDCDTCHGSPPKIPVVEKGEGPGHYSVCEQCHAAPPDNLKPSFGNLVTIHLSRAKYCTNCHGTDIGVIHAAALGNATR
jgi:hypothetical protein